jgi:hypothetical protein
LGRFWFHKDFDRIVRKEITARRSRGGFVEILSK